MFWNEHLLGIKVTLVSTPISELALAEFLLLIPLGAEHPLQPLIHSLALNMLLDNGTSQQALHRVPKLLGKQL